MEAIFITIILIIIYLLLNSISSKSKTYYEARESDIFKYKERKNEKKYIDNFFNKELLFNNKQEYLKSEHWLETRMVILFTDNNTCQQCGSEENLHVHHITYKNIGAEQAQDLVTVCSSCHQAIHDKYGYSYGGHFPLLKGY